MQKQILFSFLLFSIAFSVEAQAVEVQPKQKQEDKIKSKREQAARDILTKGLDVFGGSAMFLIGSWFIWIGSIRTIIDAVQYDKNAALQDAQRQYNARLAQPRQPGDLAVIEDSFRQIRSSIEDRGTFGFYKSLCTAAGIALIYMGYKELTYKEPVEEEVKA